MTKCFLRLLTFVAVATILAGTSLFCRADVRLPEVFASNMVLQRGMPVPVWGWADAGERVTVAFEGQTKTAVPDADGRWIVKLDALSPGGPFTMTVKGKNELKLENVLVGDVWLCSGQSNMEWTMNMSPDSKADIPNVNHPNIRLFQVEKAWEQQPQDSLKADWKVCTPDSVRNFSAVGYYFGKNLHENLNVPIGLINSSWGGTLIEPWTPPVGFESVGTLESINQRIAAKDPKSEYRKQLLGESLDKYKKWVVDAEKSLKDSQPIGPPPAYPRNLMPWEDHQSPTVLYNAMVHPLVPLAMKGAIWYQGESNLGDGMLYAEKMKALINGWRTVFNNPELGFYYVQLAPYNYGGDGTRLPVIWTAQASVEKEMPKTGMAVINDIGNLGDIHPAHKSIVGHRLALLALNRTYGKTDIAAASPEPDRIRVDGRSMVLNFRNAKSLKTRDGKVPDWFEMAGADGVFQKADAKIEGTTILLTNPSIEKPFAVRFAWDMLAEPNLQNEDGLPVSAFRAGEIPERGMFDTLIPEGKNFQLLYSFDPTRPTLADNQRQLIYQTDKSREIAGKVKRVGYFLCLKPKNGERQYVFVTMPPLDANLEKLGVPVKGTGARFQQKVSDVTVKSNVPGVDNGVFAEGCNVEFWDCNYAQPNAASIPGASDDKFDFGDELHAGASPGYGSMQIHNFAKKQTILAFNNFNAGQGCDVGIGNNTKNENPDWTFTGSAKDYEGGQFLILVETE